MLKANETEVRQIPAHFYKSGDPVWYHYQRNRWTPEIDIPAIFMNGDDKEATIDIINAYRTKRIQRINWSKISPRAQLANELHKDDILYKENLPEGSLLLREFARLCDVSPYVARQHRRVGLSYRRVYGTFNSREYLEATAVLEGSKINFYLTPEQQQEALAFWDRHRIRHQLPVIQKPKSTI
jgi:hypothetical protein